MDLTNEGRLKYKKQVEAASENSHVIKNCIKAFVSGGFICVLGQGLINFSIALGLPKEDASTVATISLILISAVLTGLGIYSKLGKFCGAGTIVPVTGFANSVVSPAIEFKKEGWVFGMGAKMFALAGPVIVYGTVTSVVVGIIYYFFGR